MSGGQCAQPDGRQRPMNVGGGTSPAHKGSKSASTLAQKNGLKKTGSGEPHAPFAPVIPEVGAGDLELLGRHVVVRLEPHVSPPGRVVHLGGELDVGGLPLGDV